MAEVTLTKENFEQEVLKSDKTVLVDFWADWCGPCKMMAPVLKEYADEHPEIKVCKCNVDEQMDLAAQFNVMSIPFFGLFKNGTMVKVFKQHTNYLDDGPDIAWKDTVYISWSSEDGYIVEDINK